MNVSLTQSNIVIILFQMTESRSSHGRQWLSETASNAFMPMIHLDVYCEDRKQGADNKRTGPGGKIGTPPTGAWR